MKTLLITKPDDMKVDNETARAHNPRKKNEPLKPTKHFEEMLTSYRNVMDPFYHRGIDRKF